MARVEILDEWFFPQAVRVNGSIVPASETAVVKYRELRDGWLKNHPKLPKEEPMVNLAPGKKDNQSGYFVRTGIIYMG